ncbi:hypothetical protein ACFVTC_19025 [Streptomyces sp. NPDC057950]|uniref:hypothetical protein n=1 Tax=Streptomyces sp. NPDC057950 TaxID=3346288 RepID=UPI0036F0B6DA
MRTFTTGETSVSRRSGCTEVHRTAPPAQDGVDAVAFVSASVVFLAAGFAGAAVQAAADGTTAHVSATIAHP